MSAVAKEVKTKKEANTDMILTAVNTNKPITIRAYCLNQSTQDTLRFILGLILEKYNKSESLDVCYSSVRSLVVNAMRANIKRILFKYLGLDIANPKDYLVGMEKIQKHLEEKNFHKFKEELMKQNLAVNTSFHFNTDGFSITVKNPFILFPHEQHLNLNSNAEKREVVTGKSEVKGQKPHNLTKIVSLEQYKIDQQIFSQSSNKDTNETIVKLDIVLNDKNTFNTETFSKEMTALQSSYREKFKEVLEGKEEEKNQKSYQTISRNFATSIRGTGEFLNQLNRIQSLDSQFYREQQLLLANYGENVFKTIQEKLYTAKMESDAFIGEIQKVGKDVFDLNKNQITKFVENRDEEIQKQTNLQIQKHKKKLEELNASLDTRIENQTHILNGQVNELLEKLNESSNQLIETTELEISKLDSIFANRSKFLKKQVYQHLEEINKSSNDLIQSTKQEVERLDSEIENKSIVLKEQVNEHLNTLSQNSSTLIESTREEVEKLDSIIETKAKKLKEQVTNHLEEMNHTSYEIMDSADNKISKLDSLLETKSENLKNQVNQHLEEMNFTSAELIESTKKEISKLDSFIETKSDVLQKQAESHSDILKEQVNLYIEEMNKSILSLVESTRLEISSLDLQFENKTLQLKEQANDHIEHLNKSNQEFMDTTSSEMSKFKEELKLELDSELSLAEIRKQDILEELNSEKESLENSIRNIKEEIRNLEKFKQNKDVMEHFVQISEEAFWKMSAKIEVIQEKEQNISNFLENINLLEKTIRKAEKELRILDIEKTDYLTKKGKVVQSVDSKIRDMEKLGDDMRKKLIEISGFEKKLNVISGSLTEQLKKTKFIDDQLSRFNKEVYSLESKKKELDHFVEDVDQKVALINSKTGDIKFMESKFNHIESMMIDLSSRHKQIITMESRLEDVKSHIVNLLHQAEHKISQMNLVIQGNKSKKRKPKRKKAFPIFE